VISLDNLEGKLTNCSVDEMAQSIDTKHALPYASLGLSFRNNQFGIDIFQIPLEGFAREFLL
jgi:hypothetical protein